MSFATLSPAARIVHPKAHVAGGVQTLSPRQTRSPRAVAWTMGALAMGVFGLSSCATDDAASKGDTPKLEAPKAAEGDEIAPHAVCEMYSKIVDARGSPRLALLQKEFESQLEKSPADRALVFATIMSRDDEKEAWKLLREDSQSHGGTVLLPLGECLVYGWWKMDDQAEPRCVQAAEKLENLALVDVARAELWTRKGEFDKSISFAENAIATDPTCAAPYILKANALEQKADDAGALVAWEGAVTASPSCFSCATRRASAVERAQGQEAALPFWEAALKIHPGHAKTLQRYAAVQVGRDDAAALSAYEQALALGQEDFATLMAAATLAVKTGQDLKAIDYGERAARVETAHVDLWRLLGGLYEKRSEMEGFEKSLIEILRLLPDDVKAHLSLSKIAIKEERFVDALDHVDEVGALFAAEKATEEEAALKPEYEEVNAQLVKDLRLQIPTLSGSIQSIQGTCQRVVRGLFEERHKSGKSGTITITVKTRKDGSVEAVNLTENTLNDSVVAASLVGNLRRAQVSGGRKLWTLNFAFQ